MAPDDDYDYDDDVQEILFERLEHDLGILIDTESDFDYDDDADYSKYRHRNWDHSRS